MSQIIHPAEGQPVSDPPQEEQVLITRILQAPRQLVFQAWTDPQHLLRWYAPGDSSIEFVSVDIRPGGHFHSCIRNPRYHDCWAVGEYLEIVAPELIRYTMAIADIDGKRIGPEEAGMDPAWPLETTVTVILEDLGDQTRLTLKQTVSDALAKKTGAHPSWLEMLDRLEQELQQDLHHSHS